MHYECLQGMNRFVKEFLDTKQKLNILEVGSFNASKPEKDNIFRRYFRDNPNWKFTGIDIIDGPNVDIVAKDPYNYEFYDNEFDVVISGNCIEHVADSHKMVKEIARITNNLVCIIVPAVREYHGTKLWKDYWRVYPEAMEFLLKDIAGLEILKCKTIGNGIDTIGVGKKI